MIGIVDVAIQAENPSMPLYPMRAFVSSPSSIRVRNVPKKIGDWAITKVYFTAAYPDSQIMSTQCVLVGGVWVGTIQGCSVSGIAENGYTIFADGTDENGNTVTGYILGKGDIQILEADGTITPTEQKYYMHLLSGQAQTPAEGDFYPISGEYYIWQNGQAKPVTTPLSAQLTFNQRLALNSGVTQTKIMYYDEHIDKWKYPFVEATIDEQPPKWIMSELPEGFFYSWDEPQYIGENQWEIFIGHTDDPGNVNDLYTTAPEDATELTFTYDNDDAQFTFTGTLQAYQTTSLSPYTNNYATIEDGSIPLVIEDIEYYADYLMTDLWFVLDASSISSDMQLRFKSENNHFHPRTDAETDFLIKAGKVNVYMMTEYRRDHYMVARWVETEGGAE